MSSADTAATVFARGRKLVTHTEWALQQLESGEETSADAPAALTQTLNRLVQEVALLDRLVSDAPADQRRDDVWRKRASQLAAEAAAQRVAVERFLKTTHASRVERAERGLLFGAVRRAVAARRARAHRNARSRAPAHAPTHHPPQARADAIAVDAFVSERASLHASHAMMDDVAAAAGSVMGALQAQRATLKGAHKRALDIAAGLGVSNSLIRIIERRTVGDRIIVYGGSVVIMILLAIVVRWRG